MNRINSAGWEYDAAGDQTRVQVSGGSWQRLEYDAAGRLVRVRDEAGSVLASYTYGATNERLISQEGDVRTYYAWSGSTVITEYTEVGTSTQPVWSKHYVYLGGRLLATIQPSGGGSERVEFHHPDRLGTRLVTNNQDGSYYEQVTLPFGVALDTESTGTTNRRFTSYDRSATTGLDYAINRHYDPLQGRFTQVDPIGMRATSLRHPQSLNLYSYCQNDPINHTDPDGLLLDALGKVFGAIGSAIGDFFGGMGSFFGGLFGGIGGFFSGISHSIGGFIGQIGGVIGGFGRIIGGAVRGVVNAVGEVLRAAGQFVGQIISGVNRFVAQQKESQNQRAFREAVEAARQILQGDNDCSRFFGGAGLAALNAIADAVSAVGNAAFQSLDSSDIGIRMELYTIVPPSDAPLTTDGIYAAVSPTSVAINTSGPFIRRIATGNQSLPKFGGYDPGSLESRVLQLLHEVGHLVVTGVSPAIRGIRVGGRMRLYRMSRLNLLLPLDAGNAPLSERNTERVLRACRRQIEALRNKK